ncbi:hypothetical protein GJR95_33700 [Spirosoma endbachense]|uniref:Uncharacterized protein n=1 Tax=Spirosoma endbachense TaxID=2666025 RepID=A0A6P1W5N3_9BACT|nr:hypothetical protein GJR95_33700 [Spirosoma endbachense]
MSTRVVLVVSEPGSVAVTVMVKGDPIVVEGVPEMVAGAVKLNPAGRLLTDRVRLAGVSESVKVLAGMR